MQNLESKNRPSGFSLDNPATNESEYQRLKGLVDLKNLPMIDAPYPVANLYNEENQYFVLDHEREQVALYLKFEIRPLLGRRAAYKIIVWSNPNISSIRGYSSTAFYKLLFSKIDLVTTDQQQVPAGDRFWRNILDVALKAHYHACVVNLSTNEIKRVKAPKDAEKLASSIWLDPQKVHSNVLVISKDPF